MWNTQNYLTCSGSESWRIRKKKLWQRQSVMDEHMNVNKNRIINKTKPFFSLRHCAAPSTFGALPRAQTLSVDEGAGWKGLWIKCEAMIIYLCDYAALFWVSLTAILFGRSREVKMVSSCTHNTFPLAAFEIVLVQISHRRVYLSSRLHSRYS